MYLFLQIVKKEKTRLDECLWREAGIWQNSHIQTYYNTNIIFARFYDSKTMNQKNHEKVHTQIFAIPNKSISG